MRNKILWILVLLMSCNSVNAHESVAAGGMISGLLHPVFGLDHLFAMVSVGILSAKMGGKAIWTVPLAFVVFMLLGGVLGVYNDSIISYLELGIGLSVFLLGIGITLKNKWIEILSIFFVGVFGVFHGYAHGIEMPYIPQPALYFLGFLLSTIFLHVAGVFIGIFIKKFKNQKRVFSILGSLIILCGLYFIIY